MIVFFFNASSAKSFEDMVLEDQRLETLKDEEHQKAMSALQQRHKETQSSTAQTLQNVQEGIAKVAQPVIANEQALHDEIARLRRMLEDNHVQMESFRSHSDTEIRRLQKENERLNKQIMELEAELAKMHVLIEQLNERNREIDALQLENKKRFGDQIAGLQVQLSNATRATQALQVQLANTSFESLTEAFSIKRELFWVNKPGSSQPLIEHVCFAFNLPGRSGRATGMTADDLGKLNRFFIEQSDKNMGDDELKEFVELFLPPSTKLNTDSKKREFFENPMICSLNGLKYSSSIPENKITKFIFLKVFYFKNFITREEYLERIIQHRLFDLFLQEKERKVVLRNGKSVTFNFGPTSFVSEAIVSSPSPSRAGAATATPARYLPDSDSVDEATQTGEGLLEESAVFSVAPRMIQINKMRFNVTHPTHGPMVLRKIPLAEEETQGATASPLLRLQSLISLDPQALSPKLQEQLKLESVDVITIIDPNDIKILDSLALTTAVVETASPSRVLFPSPRDDDQ